MRKLERIIDAIIPVQNPSTVLVVGQDEAIFNYLVTRVDNVVQTYEETDAFDLIVISGSDIDTDVISVFGNTTTVIVEESEGGRLRDRNTGRIHQACFGDFIYLCDDSPHVIIYSRDPWVVKGDNFIQTTTTLAPVVDIPVPRCTPPTVTEVTEETTEEEFESGIDDAPNPPSYYWKPSRRSTE